MKTYEEILAHIRILIQDISLGTINITDIDPDAHILGDLGLDSLDYASMLLECEKWLGIKVREEGVDWGRLSTVADLTAFLEHEQQ